MEVRQPLQNPTHDYVDGGMYHVTLTVTDDDGASDSISKDLDVSYAASIDIKPGTYPNTIYVNKKGNVPVAILTTDDFDASNVNPNTVVFLGASPCMRAKLQDVDNDSDLDMIFHFNIKALDFSLVVVEGEYLYAYLTGETNDNKLFVGKDTVVLVGPSY